MRPRVLVLTAGFGEGHNAAARALAAAFDARHGAGTARIADVFATASPRLNAAARALYLGLINRTPRLWRAVYAAADRSPVPGFAWTLLRSETRALDALLAQAKPTVVCSTYPVYAFLLARLPAPPRRSAPHFIVVTDSISINSLWWRGGGDGWFLPNDDSAESLRRAGIAPERLHVCGFPVTDFFATHAGRLAPPDLAAGAAPRVLHIVNSGTRHARETARGLLAEYGWEITCAVGHDEALRRELAAIAAERPRPARILGWTDEIPRLLLTHHVVVSKAGGATVQEAIAARCPMIVNQIVPGQEEGNYELLRRHRAGAYAPTPAAVHRELRAAFADGGRGWASWRTGLAALSRPAAANAIADRMLELVAGPAAPTLVHAS